MLEQRLQFLASEQLGGVQARRFGKMRAEHGDRVEDERAGIDGPLALLRCDPDRRQAVDGLGFDCGSEAAKNRLLGDG
jgi:hypothetical protein